MKLIICSLFSILFLSATAQEVIIDEDFNGDNSQYSSKEQVKFENGTLILENKNGTGTLTFDLPLKIDFSRDFVISVAANIDIYSASNRYYGIQFFRNDEDDSNYGLGLAKNGNYLVYARNLKKVINNSEWVKAEVIMGNSVSDVMRIHKLDNDLYLSINGQVVTKIESQEGNGQILTLRASQKQDVVFDFVRGHYLTIEEKSTLKKDLEVNLRTYELTGTNGRDTETINKLKALKTPEKYLTDGSYPRINYIPEANIVGLGFQENSFSYTYDTESGSYLTQDQFISRLARTGKIYHKSAYKVNEKRGKKDDKFAFFLEVWKDGKMIRDWANHYLIGRTDNDVFYIDDNKNNQIKKYNAKTDKTEVILKKELRNMRLTYDNRFLLATYFKKESYGYAFDLEKMEVSKVIAKKKKLSSSFMDYDEGIVRVKVPGYYDKYTMEPGKNAINLLTGEETVSNIEGMVTGRYVYRPYGRSLSIYDLEDNRFIVQDLRILKSEATVDNTRYRYFPESKEVFISQLDNFPYFGTHGEEARASAYTVHVETGTITPFLLDKSRVLTAEDIAAQNAAIEAEKANEDKLNALMSRLKSFGNSYEFTYQGFDYLQIGNESYVTSSNMGGDLRAIGKFCDDTPGHFGATKVLAVQIQKQGVGEQYIFKLLSFTLSGVMSETIGVTQKVRGNITQLANLRVSKGSSGYTINVNVDGRKKSISVKSKCR